MENVRSLSVALRRTEAALAEQLNPRLRQAGLTLEHWRVMAVLLEQPGATMSRLAAGAVIPAASLTRLADRLVEGGIVVRNLDPTDKRRVVVALSPLGARLALGLRELEDAVAADLRAGGVELPVG